MDEVGEESLLQQTVKNSAPAAVSKGNAGKKHCSGLSTENMDNKENLWTVSENSLDLSASSRTMLQTRRAKNGGGCNLRKSLAWNNAFFTEEGVLDPSELSILSGSATKSSVSLLNGISGEISPLTSYGVSNRAKLDGKIHQGSAFDDKKDVGLFSTLEPSGHKYSVPYVVPEKATLCKGICRNIPRTPAASSQKRLGNTNTSNPASKLPRFTTTRSQTSSHTPTSRCSVPAKGHSNQSIKPANIEQNARSKGSLLTPNKVLNYPTSSSRSSEHEKKSVNEASELPPSADSRTSEMGKSISYLRTPQSQLPPNRLSASIGSSNFEKVEHKFSQNAQYFQGGCPPTQGQRKQSGLRMPTPSLGFFCQVKNPPHGPQLHESQKCSTSGCSSQSLKNSLSRKHTDDFKTLHASLGWGQPGGSKCSGTKDSSISTPFSSRNTGYSGNIIVPSVTSVTNSTLRKDMDKEASKRKILRSAIKPQVAFSQENVEDTHSYCLMDEANMEKQSVSQGSGCEPESPNHVVSSADNHSFLVERKSANTLTQTNDFESAGGMCLASEDSGMHQLVKNNAITQKCSPKQPQQGDCGESETCQQWEGACETSVSAGNECSPDGKCDSFSCLSFDNNDKVVETSPLLEIETSLRCSKTPLAGSASLQWFHPSTENLVSSVEGENTECVVHGMGQRGLNHDAILVEEACGAEKSECQDCGVSFPRKENQIASEDESKAILVKQELVEKPKQVSVLLNQLKASPFSDEWIVALESFGEDILQVKTGAVQNSPPDKPTPEPGPWSPVKRKNQDIGPYDCTKYGKSMPTAINQ